MIDTLGRAFLADLLRMVLSCCSSYRGARTVLDADLSADGDCARRASGGAVSGRQAMKSHINVRNVVVALVALGLLLLPLYSAVTGNIFILTLFTRIVIFALAAASLNLIMGYGG